MDRFSFKNHLPKPSYDLTIDLIVQDINQVPEVAAVYVLVGNDGDYLYTGRTKNLRARFSYHLKQIPNLEVLEDIEFGGVDHVLVFECQDELDTKVLKQYFIEGNIYRGKYNVEFVPNIDRLIIKKDVESDLCIPYFFYQFDKRIVELEALKPEREPFSGMFFTSRVARKRKRTLEEEEEIKKIQTAEEAKKMEAEKLEEELQEKQTKAFEDLILRILKHKKSSTQLVWSIYEKDYGHLLSNTTDYFLHHMFNSGVTSLTDRIEVDRTSDKWVKIRFTGYREYAFDQFDKGNTEITPLEKFWEELQV